MTCHPQRHATTVTKLKKNRHSKAFTGQENRFKEKKLLCTYVYIAHYLGKQIREVFHSRKLYSHTRTDKYAVCTLTKGQGYMMKGVCKMENNLISSLVFNKWKSI